MLRDLNGSQFGVGDIVALAIQNISKRATLTTGEVTAHADRDGVVICLRPRPERRKGRSVVRYPRHGSYEVIRL